MDDTTPPGPPPQNGGDAGGPPPDWAKRAADLERELAKVKAERDEYKANMYSLLEQLYPYTPPTEEELHDMMHGPRGPSISEIIAEFEQKYPDG